MVAAACAGDTAAMVVEDRTVYEAAGTSPKKTLDPESKSVPVSVTAVPPSVVPEDVLRLVTVGAEGTVNVNRVAEESAVGPPAVTMATSTAPARCGGVVTTISVLELMTK